MKIYSLSQPQFKYECEVLQHGKISAFSFNKLIKKIKKFINNIKEIEKFINKLHVELHDL
jgi:hypothetical protein